MAEEREPSLMIVTGRMGVGKSHTTSKFLLEYFKLLKRPILVFDPNNEDTYHKFKTLEFDIEEVQGTRKKEKKENRRIVCKSEKNLQQFKKAEIRRILPYNRYGDAMTREQLKLTMITILQNVKGALILLEDINAYVISFAEDSIISLFKNIRHKGQDIIIHMQSYNPVRPILFEACYKFRIHKDEIDVSTIKDRIKQYELFKLAQLIVEANPNKYFFLYLDTQERKIKGCTVEEFKQAAIKYTTSHPRETINQLAFTVANENKRSTPVHSDREKARHLWIEEHTKKYLNI
jgi:hypothetical protein